MAYMYILASDNHYTLYVGMTNDLYRRIFEHKAEILDGFTYKYHVHKLVYFEQFSTPAEAIAREKQLKGWVRKKKDALISKSNPNWDDLSKDWYT